MRSIIAASSASSRIDFFSKEALTNKDTENHSSLTFEFNGGNIQRSFIFADPDVQFRP
jgi:hypothetical protein